MTNRVRVHLFLSTVLLASSIPAARPVEAQQSVAVRRAAIPDIPVRISGAFAQLRIRGWDHDSVVLTGTLPKDTRFDGGMGTVPGPSRGAKFWIEAASPDAGGGTLELMVPARARVWVKTANARVEVEGVTGEIDLNIIAGSITVRGNPREANLESMDGSVTVTGSPTWMRIKTGDGNVVVRGSSEDIAINTVGGRINVHDGPFERARIESVTGALAFEGLLVRSASFSMDSHSGAIHFSTPLAASVSIDARTLTGSIENKLNFRRPSPGREGRGEELALELGSGGALATLRSFKGSIRLTAR